MQRTKFVNDATKRPYVAFFVVLLLIYLFRAHVIRCSDVRVGELGLLAHDTSQAEVTELDVGVRVKEDVAGF